MRVILVIIFGFSFFSGYAGEEDTLTDVYKGIVSAPRTRGVETVLMLRHAAFTDAGTYVITEKPVDFPKGIALQGEWTVLRGDASDKNAVVVELFGELGGLANRHYLKLKNGDLKMLDNDLRPMKGKGNYVLKKANNR